MPVSSRRWQRRGPVLATSATPSARGHSGVVLAIGRLLRSLRLHLGADVAFVSELDEDRRVFRYIDTDCSGVAISPEDADPADQGYCRYVVDGQLPEFLHDPTGHPVSARLPVTSQLPVGTHLCVPIRFSDGTVYGTLAASPWTFATRRT